MDSELQTFDGSRRFNNLLFECSRKRCGKIFRWYQARSYNYFGSWESGGRLPDCPYCKQIGAKYLQDTKDTKKLFPKLSFKEFRMLKKQFKKEQKQKAKDLYKEKIARQ